MYTVEIGKLVKEDHGYKSCWVVDGMRGSIIHEFESIDEARSFYDSYDPKSTFMTEGSVRGGFLNMEKEGYSVEIGEVDEEGIYDPIDSKGYNYDDYESECGMDETDVD